MIKNRYFKTTQGVPFELAIGKQVAGGGVTNIPTMVSAGNALDYAAFVIDASSGQSTRVPFNQALAASSLQKPLILTFVENATTANKAITSTTPLIANTIKAELVPYKAPSNQVTVLAQTAGTIDVQQELSFKIIETTPGNSPLPTWDYTSILTLGSNATWAAIAAKINLKAENEFFTAAVNTLTAPIIGAATLLSQAVTEVAITDGGNGIITAGLPNGTGTIPLIFTGGAGSGAAGVLNVVNGVAVSTTITAGGSGYSSAPTVTIAAQTVLPGITITSLDASRHFKLVAVVLPTRANYNDYGVVYTATTTTPASAGSGTVQHLIELQKEANVRRGIGHYYTDKISFGTTGSEFGLPVDMVTESNTTQWDIVVLTGTKIEPSPTPVGTHHNKHYIFVAVPAGQGEPIVDMFE